MALSKNFTLIFILGCLAALGPFSIDMYLPGFLDIAQDLKTTESAVALSLSSFFIGISVGQLLYGPLLDKYGRKKPLYFGLILYIISSLACFAVTNINELIILRFIQAIGSCATAVASIAMVRDLFTVKESPKVFASLMLVIAVSPMLAPTAGGYLIAAVGWKYVFLFLAIMAFAILLASIYKLPESFKPDTNYSLKPKPILKNFGSVLKEPQFITYASISSLTFCGLFAYVAASPTLFMKIYETSKTGYGWIFAILSVAFIGTSQINSLLIKWYSSKKIISFALSAQCLFSVIFMILALNNWLDLYTTLIFIALFLSCLGLINPNAAALSLAPFSKNAGSASALMGAFQMGLGALASMLVSLFDELSILPIPLIMCVAALTALLFYLIGRRFIKNEAEASADNASIAH